MTSGPEESGEEAEGTPGAGPAARSARVVVAMLGARRHYAVPKLLHWAGMLDRLYTDLYAYEGAWSTRALRLLPRRLRPRPLERLLGRFDPEVPAERVVSFPLLGLWFWWRRQRLRDVQDESRVHTRAVQALNRRVIAGGLRGVDAVLSYSAASLELFEYARAQGVACILEQIGAPRLVEREILREEMERWPGWEPGLHVREEPDVLREREQAEWGLADLILTASSFTREGLRRCGVDEAKCRVVPLGISLEHFTPRDPREVGREAKLRVLFAGQVRLQKGVPYLLEALRRLDSPRLDVRIAGLLNLDPSRLQPYERYARFMGAVPRVRMKELYQWADLLVIPSLCDGFGLVVNEALASGVPVVITPNMGAEIRDGIEGQVVPVRDVEALAAAMVRFEEDRDFLRYCSANAVAGRERLGLHVYQRRFLEVINEVTGPGRRAAGPAERPPRMRPLRTPPRP